MMMDSPRVLFVCVKNGGKSQMAAGLMRKLAGDSIAVSSAGTEAGDHVNGLAAAILMEDGVDLSAQTPTQLTAQMVAGVDLVVVLGRDAQVDSAGGIPVETWDTDEPSERGIEGIERMRLIRNDIAGRVTKLRDALLAAP